jgi:O-antigen ligase
MVIPLTMGLLLVQNYAEVKRFSRSMRAKIARIAALFSKTGLLSFGIVILIPALFLSLCRGGFVTFPVTMIITFIFMIVSYRLHDRYSFTLFSIVIFGGIAFLLLMGVAPVISELQNLFASGPTSARPQTYIEAIAIIRDFPVFGIGLGNWKDIILKYHTMVGREIWQPAIAYNDTLQLAAETGLAGLACMIAFLFMIYRKAIIALKRGKDIVRQSLILGGVTAMSAALIHCQFDYLFVLPSHAVVFMVIAGLTYRISCESLAKPRGREL